ncbi:MAG: P-loop NTPase [Alphaproteobacteria bacterium]|nr:P-loop NTPase [Alphaproteobacteria bacterium]
MGIIEKAGGELHELATIRQIKEKKSKDEKRQAKKSARVKTFDLNFSALEKAGLYHPSGSSTQLALELRAVKRRLLRRIGFLRAAGERQAFCAPGRQRNLILVTSTCAGEGKSFNAANLALSLALEDQIETLLVDADILRPKVRSLLGLPKGPGLTDKFMDMTVKTKSLMRRANQAPLTVIGEGAAVDRVPELFASDASQHFWAELSSAASDRLIIIDAPPVLAATEAVILAKYVDEVVFVVGANSTPESAVASAMDELLDINPNVSLLLNRCIIGSGGSHYRSYEYYGREVRNEEMGGAIHAQT